MNESLLYVPSHSQLANDTQNVFILTSISRTTEVIAVADYFNKPLIFLLAFTEHSVLIYDFKVLY